VDHFAGVPFDDEEGEERTEEKVSHGKKVAGPNLLGMDVYERPPLLSSWPGGAHASHVLLNGPLADADAQLEQFAPDALCSPQSIAPRHLLDQGHGFLGDPWLERSSLYWLRAPCVWITDFMTWLSTPHRSKTNKRCLYESLPLAGDRSEPSDKLWPGRPGRKADERHG
jgi:hypothetical protein